MSPGGDRENYMLSKFKVNQRQILMNNEKKQKQTRNLKMDPG